jgi:hypothetical protein
MDLVTIVTPPASARVFCGLVRPGRVSGLGGNWIPGDVCGIRALRPFRVENEDDNAFVGFVYASQAPAGQDAAGQTTQDSHVSLLDSCGSQKV